MRWKDENTNDILDKLHANIGSIHEVLHTNFDCQNDVNTCVDSINDILNDCVLPLCDISMSKPYSQTKVKQKRINHGLMIHVPTYSRNTRTHCINSTNANLIKIMNFMLQQNIRIRR